MIGEQAPRDQRLAGLVELGAAQGQALAQGRIGVITEALSIRHSDEEEIEGTGWRAELIAIVVTDQALIHPTELTGNGAEFGQRERAFVHLGYLLGDTVNHTEYRAPIVAAGGRSWRCPLVTRGR